MNIKLIITLQLIKQIDKQKTDKNNAILLLNILTRKFKMNTVHQKKVFLFITYF